MLSTRHADAFERELDLEEAGIACKKEEAEQVGDQRIIREIVIDGRPIDAGSDEAPANELRPNWLDQSSALD